MSFIVMSFSGAMISFEDNNLKTRRVPNIERSMF